ncbi:MAG: hypothetical protein P8Q97_06150 [Myxococcota bacterium]|nr:hypothetical protein [Myxococcota bacterium]
MESEGISTTGISLVREHTEQMRLPRFLWVPFELGRPFGAPNAPDFQRRVLRSALELFEGHSGPVVLEDFPDDAPQGAADEDGQVGWSCPVVFDSVAGGRSGLVGETLAEMSRLAPWHEVYVDTRGEPAPGASGLGFPRVVELLGEFAQGEWNPEVESEKATQEWLRLGCDDLRTWYMEAAQGQPGRASSDDLRDWFWRDTALARLIGAAAETLLSHPEPILRMLAARALVPREYFTVLVPGKDSIHSENKGAC